MADYDVTKLVKLAALKTLAERVKSEFATKAVVEALSAQVGEIDVPTLISQLTNDKNYQTNEDVAKSIATAIAEAGHATFEKVEELPSYADAKENVLYLYKNVETQHFDIYAKVEGSNKLELIDDTTVDLEEYAKTAEVQGLLQGYVTKDGDKQLSTEDYTTAEKTKLGGIEDGATKVEGSSQNGNVKINGAEQVVYTLPEDVLHGEIATDEEVSAMLDEVVPATE